MYKNEKMYISETGHENHITEQKKPKRVEWLNVHSKGFIVESINNNYINENVSIKKQNKKTNNNKHIIPRNLKPLMSKREIFLNKNGIGNSDLSSRKTNFSYILDDDEDINNQNKSLITNLNNVFSSIIKNETDNKKKEKNKNVKNNNTNKKKNNNNNINKVEKKMKKCNSIKNLKNIKTEKNVIKNKTYKNLYKYKNKSVKAKNKNISLKKNICSPLLNYLEFRYQNLNQSIFNIINKNIKRNNKIINRNNVSCKDFSKTTRDENNNNNDNINNINNILNKTEIKKKKNRYRYSKSIKEIKVDNVNLVEIQKFMVDGRKYKKYKNQMNKDKNDYKGDIGDYTFDNDDEDEEDKLAITERRNIISFSEICSPSDIYMTNNKKGFNNFLV